LQQKLNIELRNSAAGKRKGLLGTFLVHLLLFGMLILVGFSTPPPPDTEEGILVNFGTGETGIGDIEPSPPAFKEESTAPPIKEIVTPKHTASKPEAKTKEDPLLSQNTEEAPVVKKVVPSLKKPDPEAAKKRLEKIEADKKIKEELEAEREVKRKEEAEQKRIAAEQQRESDIKNRTKNALANSQNRGTSSTGEGVAGGPGNQGDPNGSINSKVRGAGSGLGTQGNGTGGAGGKEPISYSLGGRGSRDLPLPKYDLQEGGKVVVEVSVDRSGKVVQATPGAKGSTTLDASLLKVAKEAALRASFEVKNDAPAIQKGTITYNFILK
jgi:outer membrane biosynthesis protein TonB